MYKKILAILLVLTVSFTFVLVAPQQKAKANPILGIEAGVGVYCLAALAGAGALAVLGNDKASADLSAHAQRVWDNTNDALKSAFKKTVSFVRSATTDSLELKYDLSKLTLEQQFDLKTASHLATVDYYSDVSESVYYQRAMDSTYSYSVNGVNVDVVSKYPFKPKFQGDYTGGIATLDLRQYSFWIVMTSNYEGVTYVTKVLSNNYDDSFVIGNSSTGSVYMFPSLESDSALTFYSSYVVNAGQYFDKSVSYSIENTLQAFNTTYKDYTFKIIPDSAYQNMVRGTVQAKTDEFWESTLDAGLVVDADVLKGANPDLTFDPETGTATDATGAEVPATSVIVPKPQVVTDSTGKSVVGVPVGDTGAIKEIDTGQTVETGDGAGTGTGSDTGVLQGLWDWLKGILQSILDAIKALGQLVGLMALVDLITSIIDSLKGIGLDIASILDYLNPLSEHFILTIAFVPTPTYFKDFFKDIYDKFKEKIPIFAQVFTFFGEIKNISYDKDIPSFLVHLPDDLGGKDLPIINFEFFTEYRPVVVNFIRFTAWFVFLKRLLRRLPKVVY